MRDHLRAAGLSQCRDGVDCAADPVASLVKMFVGMVEAGRIKSWPAPGARGRCS